MKRAKPKKALSLFLVTVMVTSLCGFYVQAEDSSGDTPVLVTNVSATNSDALNEPSTEDSVNEPINDSDTTSSDDSSATSTDGSDNAPIDGSDSSSADASDSDVDQSVSEVSTTDTPELIPQTLSQTMSDGVTVQVSGNLPEGINLLAKIETVSIADVEVLYAYDISLWLGETEYIIPEAVAVSFLNVHLPEAENIEAYHIDGAKVEQIDVSSDAGVATMTAESFSIYALVGSSKKTSSYTIERGDTLDLTNCKGTSTADSDRTRGTWSITEGTDVVRFTSSTTDKRSVTVEGKKAGKATIRCDYNDGSPKFNTFEVIVSGNCSVSVKYNSASQSGKTVYLLDANGTKVAKATTNGSGVATFSGVAVGSYTASVGFNTHSGSTYSAFSGSSPAVILASEDTTASISLTKTDGFDGGIVFDDAVRNKDTFDHVDIRTKGTIHVNYQVNGTPPVAKTYNTVVSRPQIKIDNGTWDDRPDTTNKDWEYRFDWLRVSPSSTVYLKCTITATNTKDPTDKSVGTLETSYSGRDAFKKAIEDCEAKKGLDFTINESEALRSLFYSYNYSWSAATSEAYTLKSGDLGACAIPGGASGLAYNTPVNVDTLYNNGYQVAGFKNGAKGTWTFSGWDHSNFNITANTAITGTWTFTEDAKYSVVYVNGSSNTPPEWYYVPESHTVKSINVVGFSKVGCTFDGWTTDEDGENPIDEDTVVEVGESVGTIYYYAKWKAKLCKVKYEWNGSIPGGAVPPPEKTVNYGTEYTAETVGTYAYYTFDGWHVRAAQTPRTEDARVSSALAPIGDFVASLSVHEDVHYVDGTRIEGDIVLYGTWTYNPPYYPPYDPPIIVSPSPSISPSPSVSPSPSESTVPVTDITDTDIPEADAPVTAVDTPTNSNTPQTGDSSNLGLMAILAVSSAAALGAVGIITRRKKRSK